MKRYFIEKINEIKISTDNAVVFLNCGSVNPESEKFETDFEIAMPQESFLHFAKACGELTKKLTPPGRQRKNASK